MWTTFRRSDLVVIRWMIGIFLRFVIHIMGKKLPDATVRHTVRTTGGW